MNEVYIKQAMYCLTYSKQIIDRRLDESERLAEDPDAEWIADEDFWAETEASL